MHLPHIAMASLPTKYDSVILVWMRGDGIVPFGNACRVPHRWKTWPQCTHHLSCFLFCSSTLQKYSKNRSWPLLSPLYWPSITNSHVQGLVILHIENNIWGKQIIMKNTWLGHLVQYAYECLSKCYPLLQKQPYGLDIVCKFHTSELVCSQRWVIQKRPHCLFIANISARVHVFQISITQKTPPWYEAWKPNKTLSLGDKMEPQVPPLISFCVIFVHWIPWIFSCLSYINWNIRWPLISTFLITMFPPWSKPLHLMLDDFLMFFHEQQWPSHSPYLEK